MHKGKIISSFLKTLLLVLVLLYDTGCTLIPSDSPETLGASPLITQEIAPKEIRPVRIAVPFKGLTPSQKFTYLSYYLPDVLRGELGILGIPVVAREKELSYLLKEQVKKQEWQVVAFR